MNSTDWSGSDLTGASFINVVLSGSTFRRANLTNLTVTGMSLYVSSIAMTAGALDYANITGVDFTKADSFRNVGGTHLVGMATARFPANVLSISENTFGNDTNGDIVVGDGVVARNLNLSGQNLSGKALGSADLQGSDFRNSNLTNAHFSNSDLRTVNFRGAVLTGGSFYQNDLRNVNFSGTDMTGRSLVRSDLRNANLSGVNMTGAYLYGANLTGITFTDGPEPTITGVYIDDGTTCRNGVLFAGGAVRDCLLDAA